jgi:hypothetical protein
MNWFKAIVVGFQIARNHKALVPEIKEAYDAYVDARADKNVTLAETRKIMEEVFDVLALAIPAFRDLKSLKDNTTK